MKFCSFILLFFSITAFSTEDEIIKFGNKPNINEVESFCENIKKFDKSEIINKFGGFFEGLKSDHYFFKQIVSNMINVKEDYELVSDLILELSKNNLNIGFSSTQISKYQKEAGFHINSEGKIIIFINHNNLNMKIFEPKDDSLKTWRKKIVTYTPSDKLFHELNHLRQFLKDPSTSNSTFSSINHLFVPGCYPMLSSCHEKISNFHIKGNIDSESKARKKILDEDLEKYKDDPWIKELKLVLLGWPDDFEFSCISGFYGYDSYDPINENARIWKTKKGIRLFYFELGDDDGDILLDDVYHRAAIKFIERYN